MYRAAKSHFERLRGSSDPKVAATVPAWLARLQRTAERAGINIAPTAAELFDQGMAAAGLVPVNAILDGDTLSIPVRESE